MLLLLALWLVTVLCSIRCLYHNLISVLAVPGQIRLKYSICWCFQYKRNTDLTWPTNKCFLTRTVYTSSLQGYSYMKQEHPWILQQLSAAFCSHGGVHDRILSINGWQKTSNMQIQARPHQFDLNIVCTGEWKENIALPGTLSQISSWNKGLEGFHFPLLYKNVFFSKIYRRNEKSCIFL